MLLSLVLALSTSRVAWAVHSHARQSLNFGTETARKVAGSSLQQDRDTSLDAFHTAFALAKSLPSNLGGLSIAEAFVKHLHPEQEFRLQSHSESNDGSIVHAYYIQTSHGRDIIDGLINFNIDMKTQSVISFGDSAFIRKTAEACSFAPLPNDNQIILGASKSLVQEKCAVSASETVSINETPIDPRLAIATFLFHADPAAISDFISIDDLLEGISVDHSINTDSSHALLLQNVPGAVSEKGVPARLSYVQREGELALTWSFEYESNNNWYEAHISAAQDASDLAQPLLVVDWQRDAAVPLDAQSAVDYAYRVFEWGINDPTEGHRHLIKNPADKISSPFAWHTVPKGAGQQSGRNGSQVVDPEIKPNDDRLYSPGWSSDLAKGASFKDTRGNNVFASANPTGGVAFETCYRPQSDNGTFDYKLGWGKKKEREGHQVEPKTYINVSITELFYTCNEIHDLFYRYGFNEISGNFQEHNQGRGGLGGDAVVAMAQDGSGMNNANFATPPDGSRPRMRMYVWSGVPETDGDLEAGIVIHEYMHGISTRLTGGPANSGCLGFAESGGMGEGYGDFAATIIRMQDEKVRDYSMGAWAAHRNGGIRKYPYSTNMTVNPETYKTLDGPGYWGVHQIGEVYAEMMFEVAEDLIKKHGWTPSLFPPANGTAEFDDFFAYSEKTGRHYPRYGNAYVLQLLVDSFKLQPCRPSFFDNRDAILQADQIYTGGDNYCLIYKAFARRGLGPDATLRGGTPWGGGIRANDFSIPKKCIDKHN